MVEKGRHRSYFARPIGRKNAEKLSLGDGVELFYEGFSVKIGGLSTMILTMI